MMPSRKPRCLGRRDTGSVEGPVQSPRSGPVPIHLRFIFTRRHNHSTAPRTYVESRETVLTSRPVPWNPSSSLKFVYSARPAPPQPSPANRHSVRETFLKCLLTSLRVPLTSSLCDPFSKTFRVVSLCEPHPVCRRLWASPATVATAPAFARTRVFRTTPMARRSLACC